jgi:AcrR family transcriptional regulator
MGLRETKKLATRQQIAGVAMRLFAIKGFDHVTVSEIAAEAGVSEKTVFNYFPTKEDLFFDEVPERLRRITEAIHDRAPGESILDTLRQLQLGDAPRMCSEGFAVFARIMESSPALQAKEVDVMARFAQVLATTLQEEGLAERDARIAAGLLMAVHRQFFRGARKQALEGKTGPAALRQLKADLGRAYELLDGGLATVFA